MRKISIRNIIKALFYILFFLLLLKNSLSYLDPDFPWHLKAGEEIYLNKQVNLTDEYNYVFENTDKNWTNHEWLSDFLIFIINNNYGYLVLNIIFASIIIFCLININNFIEKEIVNNKNFIFLLFIIEIIGLKAMFPHLGIRIQELSILFLSSLLIFIYFFEKNSIEKKYKNYKNLLFLSFLIYSWANLHASFLIGIFILFFYLAVKISEKIIYEKIFFLKKFLEKFINFKNILTKKDLKTFFIIILISSSTSLLTPYGLKLFKFLYSYQNTAYLKIISEWLPQYYFPFLYWQFFYIGLIMAIIILYFINEKKEKKLDIWSFAILFLFLYLSIKSKRHFPLLFISSLPIISFIIYNDFRDLFLNIKKQKIDLFLKIYLIISLIAVSCLLIISINWKSDPFSSFCHDYPCQAIDFLKNNSKASETRVFNNYAWGGFMIHQYPEQKIFIDGRQPQKKLNNHSYLEEYMLFFTGNQELLEEKIKEYQINLFFIQKNPDIKLNWIDKNILKMESREIKINQNLINFLESSKNWEKIYEDKISIIYKKNEN